MPGKLTYFDLGGRAEGIRALLFHANFQYEDCRINFEEWASFRESTPLGSLPIWDEDGVRTI